MFGPSMLRSVFGVSAMEGGVFVITSTAVTGVDVLEKICDTEENASILCPVAKAAGSR